MTQNLWGLLRKFKWALLLGVILLISSFFRLWKLAELPAGFQYDEAFAAYNAFSILKTGRSVSGEMFPMYINTFGDYRVAGIVYLTIPSILLLGLNEFAVRLPIALIGAVSPLLLYSLVKKMASEKSIAVVSALFLALSPWHINLSRSSSEQVFGIFMVMAIANLALISINKKRKYWWVLTYFAMAVSFFTYPAVNLFMPLFLIILTWYLYRTHGKKGLAGWWLVMVLYLIFPVFSNLVFSHAAGRAGQVVRLYEPDMEKEIQKAFSQEAPGTPVLWARLWHNKLVSILQALTQRYLEYFSWDFLLFKGGFPHRLQVPGVGVANIIVLMGLVGLARSLIEWKKKKSQSLTLLFFTFWLLVAPIAAAITIDDHPNMSRASIMIIPLMVLPALGAVKIWEALEFKGRLVVFSIAIAVGIWHFGYFWHQYSVQAKYGEWLYRNFPSREVAIQLKNIPKDDRVLATTYFLDTNIYVLFFQKIDPKIAQYAYKNATSDGISFLNYKFTNQDACASKLDLGYPRQYQVFVDNFYCDEPWWAKVIKIPMADGSVGAKILIDKQAHSPINLAYY